MAVVHFLRYCRVHLSWDSLNRKLSHLCIFLSSKHRYRTAPDSSCRLEATGTAEWLGRIPCFVRPDSICVLSYSQNLVANAWPNRRSQVERARGESQCRRIFRLDISRRPWNTFPVALIPSSTFRRGHGLEVPHDGGDRARPAFGLGPPVLRPPPRRRGVTGPAAARSARARRTPPIVH